MDEQTCKRIEELERINREHTAKIILLKQEGEIFAANLAALKAEAEKPAPKFKKGDRAYIPVEVIRLPGEIVDGKYIVVHKETDLHWPIAESDLLPASPALVPVVPGELNPGDEVYVKAKFAKINSTPGVIDVHVYCGAYSLVNNFDADTVYQVR